MLSLTLRNVSNIFIHQKKFLPIVQICNRHIVVEKPNRLFSTENVEREYTPLYHLRYIGVLSAISRAKTYQGMLTAVCVPATLILEMVGSVETGTAISTAFFGLVGSIILSLYSWRIANIIGIIYVSKKMDVIKISYVNFWGKRIDKLIPTNDWVPLSELEHSPFSKYYLKVTDTQETWKLFHKSGTILDKDLFTKVLGLV